MRGTVLADRYRLVDWLGGGSMGDVWLAEDEVLGRRVAVKVVKPVLLDEPGFAERFHAEARVMAQLRHPGIVGVHDFGHGEAPVIGRPVAYLVMELIDGEPLSAVLARRGSLPVEEVLRMALQVLEALAAAHGTGVVHRDVKPANLMVCGDRTVIADFGIARPGSDARLTVPGMVLGTAAYQAPEQASSGPVTGSADLYALGVVLYECLAGGLPFDGETALEVILKHLTEPVPPLPDAVPGPVRALVERAMAKDLGERWPDAAAMAEAVREALAAGVGEDARAAAIPSGRASAGRGRWTGLRRRTVVSVVAMAVLGAAGATGAVVNRPGSGTAPYGGAVAAGPTADAGQPGGPGGAVAPESPAPSGGPEASGTPTPTPSADPSAGDGGGPVPASVGTPGPGAAPVPPGALAQPAALPASAGQASAGPARQPSAAPTTAGPAPAPAQPTATAPPAVPTATPQPQPTQPPKPAPQLPSLAVLAIGSNALDNAYSVDKDGNRVGTYPVNRSAAQQWRLEPFGDGRYFLRNGSTNYTKVLDLELTTGRIQVWTNPPGAENQLWSFLPVPGGYEVVNASTKQCLTSDGMAQWVRTQACSAEDNQVWTLS
ncbi:protein kinase [Streptomyces sp. SP17BM10]|uniref:serine/threonine protein kinase n=1 Tax=Streptomyces sp. SP17BM10 TaxID=3002530 RepID=UPI002E7679A7|nr:protein kinase [Streptomyces sp. SP17BM10]MEE1788509.1 protein kinase [Streptomyces sp. SP17BM10]